MYNGSKTEQSQRTLNPFYKKKTKNKKKNRKLTCDTVLLTKAQILFKFHKTLC